MNIFEKNSIGLDIADRSVEVVKMARSGGRYEVLSMGRASLEKGVVERGRIKNEAKLAEAIRSAMASAVPQPIQGDRIIFAFPENLVYTYVFELEEGQRGEAEAAVRKVLEKNIPLESDDLQFSFILGQEKKPAKAAAGKKENAAIQVAAIAFSQQAGLDWVEFFQRQNLSVDYFDTETFSIFRSMTGQLKAESVCILDIGAATTNIAIFNRELLVYAHSLDSAGEKMTKNMSEIRANAEGAKLGSEMAEKAKKKFGLSEPWDFQKEAELIIRNTLRGIIQETKVALAYVKNRYSIEIRDVVLVGGTSKMKGLLEFFDKNLNDFPALAGKVAGSGEAAGASGPTSASLISVRNGFSNYLPFETQMEYLEAIGLAIFGLDSKFGKLCPAIDTKIFRQIKKRREAAVAEAQKSAVKIEEKKYVSWIKEHKQEAELLAVLLLGVVFLGGAFWYRSYSNQKRLSQQPFGVVDEFVKKEIYLEMPLVFEARDFLPGRIKGRKIEDRITEAMALETAEKKSKSNVEAKLKKGEVLWPEPFGQSLDADQLIFPLTFEWVAYFEKDIRTEALARIKALFKEAVFTFDGIRQESLIKASSSPWLIGNVVSLSIKAGSAILVSGEIDFVGSSSPVQAVPDAGKKEQPAAAMPDNPAGTEAIVPEAEAELEAEAPIAEELSLVELSQALLQAKAGEEKGRAIILPTGTGWLNVRSGPGIDFEIIAKVNTGEAYEILDEEAEWINISLADGQSGWISANFAIIK